MEEKRPRTSECLPPFSFSLRLLSVSSSSKKTHSFSFHLRSPSLARSLSPSTAPRRVFYNSLYYAAPLRAQRRDTIPDATLRSIVKPREAKGDDDGEKVLPAASAIGDDHCRCLFCLCSRFRPSLLAAIEARPCQTPPGKHVSRRTTGGTELMEERASIR